MFKNLLSKQNKSLLLELVRTDFKLRYQGSVLGYTWSLLRPLLMFLVLYLVFALVFKVGKDIPNYPIYLLLGIVLWNFFQEVTSQSLSSIVNRGDLIRKIRIPRWMIVISASIGALINLALNTIVVIIFALITGTGLLSTSPLIIFFILEIYIFSLGVGLLLAALFVRYRDISYIWDVVLQAGFYAVPILYPISLITNVTVQKIMFLNPMTQAIQGARNVSVTSETVTIGNVWNSQIAFLMPVALVIVVFILGVLYFKREAKDFAENV